jgi:hypothetical protein
VRTAFRGLSASDQDSIIEFLKTLQILPPGTVHLIVDEQGKPKNWPLNGGVRPLRSNRP